MISINSWWKLIPQKNIGLDDCYLHFTRFGEVLSYSTLSDIPHKHYWRSQNDRLILSFYNGYSSYTGTQLFENVISGQAKNQLNESWSFKMVKFLDSEHHISEPSNLMIDLFINKWNFIENDPNLRTDVAVFVSNGEFRTDNRKKISSKWQIIDEKLHIFFNDAHIHYIGEFNGNSIKGTAKNIHGLSWDFEFTILNKSSRVEKIPTIQNLVNTNWDITLSQEYVKQAFVIQRSASFLPNGKVRLVSVKSGKEMSGVIWKIMNDRVFIVTDNEFATYKAEFIGDLLSGYMTNKSYKKFKFIGRQVVVGNGTLETEAKKIPIVPPKSLEKIFKIGDYDDDSRISYLGEYHRYWEVFREVKNPNFDEFSQRILRLKESEEEAMKYFFGKLNTILSDTEKCICYVPSSDKDKLSTGIRKLCAKLAAANKGIDFTNCIVRHTSIAKAAHGGRRSVQVHLDSLRVTNSELLSGKQVLLLDDVTTTGSSLLACKKLLIDAGASKVYCFALAQTT
ncbi:ComF family protein [Pedobacter sp. BMA]|uniref:ComF family protein n=1 Tax=Pedobacter sp. BMA TaxID=1663685 RepID=UPI00069F3A89|nr:phosphoribosyltransferase [Pedobacter sp. BMA]